MILQKTLLEEKGMLSIKEALVFGRKELGSSLESEILLAFVLHQERSYLLAHDRERLSPDAFQSFEKLAADRKAGRPISYITRDKEFFGLPFYVDERCLIPRPETELLVEMTLWEISRQKLRHPKILDIGTGSGAIAIALGHTLPDAKIIGIDISNKALEVAEINRKKFGLSNVSFLQSDLLEKVTYHDFDVIVANLPYIGEEKFSFVEKEVVENEPLAALFGGYDGLDLYRRLFRDLALTRKQQRIFASLKFFAGEFGFLQGETLTKEMNKYFDQEPEFFQDLAGIDRLFMIRFRQ